MKNLWKNPTAQRVVLVLTIMVMLAIFFSWMLPTYKKEVKTSETYKQSWETLKGENITLKSENEQLKSIKTNEMVTGYLKEPVQMANGVVAYRTAKWSANKSSDVTESVRLALRSVSVSSALSSGTTETVITKEVKVTKRGRGCLGLGYGDAGQIGGLLGVNILGPLGVWGMVLVDVAPEVKLTHGMVGGKLEL